MGNGDGDCCAPVELDKLIVGNAVLWSGTPSWLVKTLVAVPCWTLLEAAVERLDPVDVWGFWVVVDEPELAVMASGINTYCKARNPDCH